MFNTLTASNKVGPRRYEIRTGGIAGDGARSELRHSSSQRRVLRLLSSGVADGTFFPLESIISFKLGSVVKYATLFPGGFYCSSFGFFMNEDKWNKLSKKDQDAIASVSGEPLALLAGKAWDTTDAEALEEMKRVGIQISTASPELVKGVQARAEAIDDKWVKDATAKGIDGVKVLAEFHEELKRVAAGK
jgi:TRAP-type C4-dicarboxylate transport system substrate-binding protein